MGHHFHKPRPSGCNMEALQGLGRGESVRAGTSTAGQLQDTPMSVCMCVHVCCVYVCAQVCPCVCACICDVGQTQRRKVPA